MNLKDFQEKTGISIAVTRKSAQNAKPLPEYYEMWVWDYGKSALSSQIDMAAKMFSSCDIPTVRHICVSHDDVSMGSIATIMSSGSPLLKDRCYPLAVLAVTDDFKLFDLLLTVNSYQDCLAAETFLGYSHVVLYRESYDGETPISVAGLQAWEDVISVTSKNIPESGTMTIHKYLTTIWKYDGSGRGLAHSVLTLLIQQPDTPPAFIVYDPDSPELMYYPDYATPEIGFIASPYGMNCYEIAVLKKLNVKTMSPAGIIKRLQMSYSEPISIIT